MSDLSLESVAQVDDAFDLTEKRFREIYGYKKVEPPAFVMKEKLWKLFVPTKKSVFKFFPVLKWLPKYDMKSSFLHDLITGLTIGTMQIPQGNLKVLLFIRTFINRLIDSSLSSRYKKLSDDGSVLDSRP